MAGKIDGGYYISAPEAERGALRAFAMAACTLGAVLRPRSFTDRRYVDSLKNETVREVFWHFNSRTQDGKYLVLTLYKWWRDPEWLKANPDHPLSVLRQYAKNLQLAEEHESKVIPRALIIRGRRHLSLPTRRPERFTQEQWDKTKNNALKELHK